MKGFPFKPKTGCQEYEQRSITKKILQKKIDENSSLLFRLKNRYQILKMLDILFVFYLLKRQIFYFGHFILEMLLF